MSERLSVREAVEYVAREWGVRVSPETIRRWVRTDVLPAVATQSGHLRVSVEALHAAFEPKNATVDND